MWTTGPQIEQKTNKNLIKYQFVPNNPNWKCFSYLIFLFCENCLEKIHLKFILTSILLLFRHLFRGEKSVNFKLSNTSFLLNFNYCTFLIFFFLSLTHQKPKLKFHELEVDRFFVAIADSSVGKLRLKFSQ